MRAWIHVVLAVALAACGSEGEDDVHDTGAARSCAELKADYNAVLEGLDRTCDDVADCELVGPVTSCNGNEPHLATSCGGAPVQRAAYEAVRETTLDAIVATMRDAGCFDEARACDELGCTFDCSPSALRCSEAGQCSAIPTEYCWEPADAGVAP